MWFCIFASCIFMGCTIYIFTHWFDNTFAESPRKLTLWETYWFIYGAILRQGSIIDPKSSKFYVHNSWKASELQAVFVIHTILVNFISPFLYPLFLWWFWIAMRHPAYYNTVVCDWNVTLVHKYYWNEVTLKGVILKLRWQKVVGRWFLKCQRY